MNDYLYKHYWRTIFGSLQLCVELSIIALAAFLFMASSVLGIDTEMQEARLFFDAGDYQQATIRYKEILDENLLPWQKAVIFYNRATVLLAQGKLEEALKEFQSINIEEMTLPLLKLRLQTNKALARLLLAKSELSSLGDDSSYTQLILLFRQIFEDIKMAKIAACELSTAEGAMECEDSPDLDEMYLEAKKLYVKLLQDFGKYSLMHATPEESGSALLSAAKAMLKHLDFLNSKDLEENLKEQYRKVYREQEESWRPLWKQLAEILSKEFLKNENRKELESLFRLSEKKYFEGVSLIQKGQDIDSRQAIQQSIESMNGFLQLIFGERALKESVQRLLVNYHLVLGSEPMQEILLQGLKEAQSYVGQIIEKNQNNYLKTLYEDSQHYLALGLQVFQSFKPLLARAYIEEANYLIKGLAQELESRSKDEPKTILKNAIEAQNLALKFAGFRLRENEDDGGAIDSFLMRAQERTLQIAAGFYHAAIVEQTAGFKAVSEKNIQDVGCQNSPWDEVIPLVVHGMEHAGQALEILSQTSKLKKSVTPLQELALNEWKEALKKLEQKTKNSQNQQKNDESKEENKPQPPNPSSQNADTSSLNDVMLLLQEMEKDDRSKPQIMESPVKKETARPW